jgi:hypothetical protein
MGLGIVVADKEPLLSQSCRENFLGKRAEGVSYQVLFNSVATVEFDEQPLAAGGFQRVGW